MITRILWRRDTSANWTLANPVLADGEAGLETDTKKWKMGDGVTTWRSLAFMNASNISINTYQPLLHTSHVYTIPVSSPSTYLIDEFSMSNAYGYLASDATFKAIMIEAFIGGICSKAVTFTITFAGIGVASKVYTLVVPANDQTAHYDIGVNMDIDEYNIVSIEATTDNAVYPPTDVTFRLLTQYQP